MRIIFLFGLGVFLPGCAMLGLSSQDLTLDEDPIARVALAHRIPSGYYGDAADGLESAWEGVAQARYRTEEIQEMVHRAMQARQVTLGMDMTEVRALWGNPQSVESAGDARFGNQRWTYHTGLSSYGMGSARIIYFENGQVAGWESK